jgi:hypothetical protein
MANKNVYMRTPDGEVFNTNYPDNHKDCVKIMAKEGKAAMRDQACAELRKMLKPGKEICCILRSVSKSGMSRSISLVVAIDDDIRNITSLVATALEYNVDKNDGISVSGCGRDMGFHLVYNLGSALWPNGTPEPHGTRNSEPDSDGGYALKHRWL